MAQRVVSTPALVLGPACRCQIPAWTRSTCCCPDGVARVDSCFLHAGRRTVTALEEVLGYIVTGSESVRVEASGVGHTLEEEAHGHGGLGRCN